jgi:hypothetical protein
MTAILHPLPAPLWRRGRGHGGGYGSLKSVFASVPLETGFRNDGPIPRILAYSSGVNPAEVTLVSILAY